MSVGRRTFFLLGMATRPRPIAHHDTALWPPNPLLEVKRFASQEDSLDVSNSSSFPQPSEEPGERTIQTEQENGSNLFEDDTEEYHLSLPSRATKSLIPPWPSIFAPSTPGSSSSQPTPPQRVPTTSDSNTQVFSRGEPRSRRFHRKRPRHTQDLIKYIRYQQDIPTATLILSDLREIGVDIKPSRLYVHAATLLMRDQELRGNMSIEDVRQGVLSWISLAPPVKGIYSPLYARYAWNFTSTLIQTFPSPSQSDITFLADVLKLSARNRSLPVFVNPVLRHLVVVAGPRRSHELLNELLQIWMQEVLAMESTSRSSPAPFLSGDPASSDSGLQNNQELATDLPSDPVLPRPQRNIVTLSLIKHTNVTRNHFLRSLLLAGYVEDGASLFQLGNVRGIVWEVRTKEMLVKALTKEKQRMEGRAWRVRLVRAGRFSATAKGNDGEVDLTQNAEREDQERTLMEDMAAKTDDASTLQTPAIRDLLRDHLVPPSRAAFDHLTTARKVRRLSRPVRRAASEAGLDPARYLMGVMMELDLLGKGEGSESWERFKRRYVRGQARGNPSLESASPFVPAGKSHLTDATSGRRMQPPTCQTESYWYLAEILRQREIGRHLEAVALFRSKFFWIGLPALRDHPAEFIRALPDQETISSKSSAMNAEKLYPTRQVIRAVLPCILSSMPGLDLGGLVAYHKAFMASAVGLPQYIQPDGHTCLAFVRFAGRVLKSAHTELFAKDAAARGQDIGVIGWVAIAVSWIKEGRTARALDILDRLIEQESKRGTHNMSEQMILGPRSFIVLVVAALQRKDKKGASLILDRLKQTWPMVQFPEVVPEEGEPTEEQDEEGRLQAATG